MTIDVSQVVLWINMRPKYGHAQTEYGETDSVVDVQKTTQFRRWLNTEKVNPCQKPPQWGEWLALTFGHVGDRALVLGSGAGGETVSLLLHGINVTGIDKDAVQVKFLADYVDNLPGALSHAFLKAWRVNKQDVMPVSVCPDVQKGVENNFAVIPFPVQVDGQNFSNWSGSYYDSLTVSSVSRVWRVLHPWN